MVSIVLPTYNGEKYLRESIKSVIGQTYSDWKLIIVDDCSTDSTLRIAEEFASKDPRITVIHNQTNMRLPASLNIGFDQACGEYLTWTSDDNLFDSNALKCMVDYLDNSDCPLVCAEMNVIDENGKVIKDHYMTRVAFNSDRIFFDNIVRACFMYRREVLDTVGKYNETLFGIEDYDYWLRIFKRYLKIGHIDEKLYYYRVHAESLTTTRKTDIESKAHAFRMNNFEYLIEKRIRNPLALTTLLCESLRYGEKTVKDRHSELCELVPEISIIDLEDDFFGKYIIYGAGDYGHRVEKKLGKKAAYFADRNGNCWGTYIEGKRVLSLDEMNELKDQYMICVSLGYEKVYEVLLYLMENGYKRCVLCYQISEF